MQLLFYISLPSLIFDVSVTLISNVHKFATNLVRLPVKAKKENRRYFLQNQKDYTHINELIKNFNLDFLKDFSIRYREFVVLLVEF